MVIKNINIEDFYKKIGKNVAKYRKEAGLSQLELSLQMGYKSISIVSSAEIYYNKKHFNLEHLVRISEILNIDLCKLIKGWFCIIFERYFQGKTMIQETEAKELKSLIYGVLEDFFLNPASGAILKFTYAVYFSSF